MPKTEEDSMPKRVLIADDAKLVRHLIKKALINAGFEIVGEAQNGQEAIALFAELKPDLVMMDLVMPKTGGMDAVKEIITIDPHARILVVTSLSQQMLAQDAMRLGVKGVITKPFDPETLMNAVHRIID
jgi:two-component system chemotaxis response regulator CheY